MVLVGLDYNIYSDCKLCLMARWRIHTEKNTWAAHGFASLERCTPPVRSESESTGRWSSLTSQRSQNHSGQRSIAFLAARVVNIQNLLHCIIGILGAVLCQNLIYSEFHCQFYFTHVFSHAFSTPGDFEPRAASTHLLLCSKDVSTGSWTNTSCWGTDLSQFHFLTVLSVRHACLCCRSALFPYHEHIKLVAQSSYYQSFMIKVDGYNIIRRDRLAQSHDL